MTALDIFELQSALRSGDVNLKAFVNTLTTHIDKDDRPEVWIHRVSLPDLIDRAAALDELARA
ncbi:hypothetical protein OA77_29120, partial [Pseudomonas coronafaciens]